MKREDPVGPEYYVPLRSAERISDAAFYGSAVASVLILLVDKTGHPRLYELVEATFALAVITLFAGGILVKTYFAARAQSRRAADFVSNAFSIPLIPNPSRGYYNSPAGDAFLRMAASILENTLFTKSILAKMLLFERARVCVYVVVWLLSLFHRATDLEILAVAAQVLFSEQLLSRWVRMEWLRLRVERLHDEVYALLRSAPDVAGTEFRARVVEALLRYETGKAQAGISLSSSIFKSLNSRLSVEWMELSRQLGLEPPGGGDEP